MLKHRPNIRLLRFYCLACAMHFHYDRLIGQMEAADAAAVPMAGPDNAGLIAKGNDASFQNKVHLAMQAKGFDPELGDKAGPA